MLEKVIPSISIKKKINDEFRSKLVFIIFFSFISLFFYYYFKNFLILILIDLDFQTNYIIIEFSSLQFTKDFLG